MTEGQFSELLQEVNKAIPTNNGGSYKFRFLNMQELSDLDKQVLVEKHLISPGLAAAKRACGVIISGDEKISIMVNEEDHMRIQCLFPGMDIKLAKELCCNIDNMLEEKFEFAFSPQLGYLTCCPTNLGTAVRASVMLHLPALSMSNHVQKILEICGKLGIAVRGLYGEYSDASGNLFQISNQTSLGQTEDEIIASVRNVAVQIIDSERTLRHELHSRSPIEFEDSIYRAYGLLLYSRTITTDESMKLISRVRMGADMGIIKDVDAKTLDRLTYQVQPASLQKRIGKLLTPAERDSGRASVIREIIEEQGKLNTQEKQD